MVKVNNENSVFASEYRLCNHQKLSANNTRDVCHGHGHRSLSTFPVYHWGSLEWQKPLSSLVHHQVVIIVRSLSSSFKSQELAYIGIGKHSAIALSKAGWNVVLIARRELELQETAAQCPNPVLVSAGDVTDESFVKQAFKVAKSHFGRYHQNAQHNTCIMGSPYCYWLCAKIGRLDLLFNVSQSHIYIYNSESLKKNLRPLECRHFSKSYPYWIVVAWDVPTSHKCKPRWFLYRCARGNEDFQGPNTTRW